METRDTEGKGRYYTGRLFANKKAETLMLIFKKNLNLVYSSQQAKKGGCAVQLLHECLQLRVFCSQIKTCTLSRTLPLKWEGGKSEKMRTKYWNQTSISVPLPPPSPLFDLILDAPRLCQFSVAKSWAASDFSPRPWRLSVTAAPVCIWCEGGAALSEASSWVPRCAQGREEPPRWT